MTIQVDKHDLRSTVRSIAADVTATRENHSQRGFSGAAAGIDYSRMAAKLSAGGHNPATLNALGVCHMRLGNIAEAVRLYRGIALQPGCTWERPDIPALYKRNFATALLLAGLPGGCVSVLQSLSEVDHWRSRQLFAAIKNWERSLSFIQRWDWRLNGVVPRDCCIEVNFEPGEFEDVA